MGSPGIVFSELEGIMKSEVTIKFSSGRAETPCGLKPSCGGREAHSWTKCGFLPTSAPRPGPPPVCDPICVIRTPPVSKGRKSSVMLDLDVEVENKNLG